MVCLFHGGFFRQLSFQTIQECFPYPLTDIGTLSHEAENLLDGARKGKLTLESNILDVIFDSVDALKRLVDDMCNSLSTGEPLPHDNSLPQLLKRIKNVAAGKGEQSYQVPEITPGMKIGEILVETGKATGKSVNKAVKKQETEGCGKLHPSLYRHLPASVY